MSALRLAVQQEVCTCNKWTLLPTRHKTEINAFIKYIYSKLEYASPVTSLFYCEKICTWCLPHYKKFKPLTAKSISLYFRTWLHVKAIPYGQKHWGLMKQVRQGTQRTTPAHSLTSVQLSPKLWRDLPSNWLGNKVWSTSQYTNCLKVLFALINNYRVMFGMRAEVHMGLDVKCQLFLAYLNKTGKCQ
jgi:hypothetical protein